MRMIVYLAGGIFVAGIAVLAWRSTHAGREEATSQPDSAPSHQQNIDHSKVVRALGYVEPTSEIRRLVFKVEGVISRCPVEIGQRVKAGDTLLSLRNHGEQAAVAMAEQELALAKAEREQLLAGTPEYQLIAAQDKIELLTEHVRSAQKQLDRFKTLAERKVVAEEELDRTETELIRAKKSLQQAGSDLMHLKNVVRDVDKLVANAKVELAHARLLVAKEHLADTILTAPSDGTVLEILRREGEGSRPMDREPVIVFADDARCRIRAEIDERFVSKLKTGQQAVVYGRGLGDQKSNGTVTFIKGVMGPKTVFSRDAAERKDLDVIQVLIDMPESFHAPLGLQVDVDVTVE